jgi:S1-C subfamily serine protease
MSTGVKIILGVGFFIFCIAGGFGGGYLAATMQSRNAAPVSEMVRPDGSAVITTGEELIATVAAKVSPSVVSIVTSTASSMRYSGAQSAGTGVIISKDGYIMTNNHVIDNARSVSIILSDGTRYADVRVVGSDPLNDIAFIKVSGVSDLKPAELGDSSRVRIGQQVVAIGNALGQFQNTVTSGIISATGRPLTASSSDGSNSESLTDLIQTDAAINSGNSGGPLVDLSGRVVGINTAVATDANGIGFAIPINATRGVLDGVLETGEVERAYLGVRYVDITPEIAAAQKLSSKRGAFVKGGSGETVASGSPAEKAGVRVGDIITKVNDEVVGERGTMSSLIGQYRPGSKISLTVLRDGKEIQLQATLATYTGR